jgi:hypothetical protein
LDPAMLSVARFCVARGSIDPSSGLTLKECMLAAMLTAQTLRTSARAAPPPSARLAKQVLLRAQSLLARVAADCRGKRTIGRARHAQNSSRRHRLGAVDWRHGVGTAFRRVTGSPHHPRARDCRLMHDTGGGNQVTCFALADSLEKV